mgnify:CR=1 FL=1
MSHKGLTGTDTDRLKEEQKRGITIELGFANLPNDAGIHIGIIDVPGHEKFVKNMLAGIGASIWCFWWLPWMRVLCLRRLSILRFLRCFISSRALWCLPRPIW